MMTINPRLGVAVTAVFFVVAVLVGFKLVTSPVDPVEEVDSCTLRSVASGEQLTTNLVTVNVYNASGREGLANRLNINLQRLGFLPGKIGNSSLEAEVPYVTILTDDQTDPEVQLVRAQFPGEVTYAPADPSLGDGVVIVVGPGFTDLAPEAPTEVTTDREIRVCVPIVEL